MSDLPGVTFVGFGEAARAFTSGFRSERNFPIAAYDVKTGQPPFADEMRRAFAAAGVQAHSDLRQALLGARLVVCLVTADQALQAAEVASEYLASGTVWLDGNSCSPGTKQRAAAVIGAVGGRYVDMAIMSPVKPRLHRTPVLLSGEFASEVAEDMGRRGMDVKVIGLRVGEASSIKMLRSVMIKGLEALTAECLLAARKAGVEDFVLASLQNSDPGFDWVARSSYNLERMRVHGVRRAAEMREVAATLHELGLPNRLATATAEWQDQLGRSGAGGNDLKSQLDSALASLE